MRRVLVAANWKMHGRRAMIGDYVAGLHKAGLHKGVTSDAVELAICPPAVHLPELADELQGIAALGAQDCSSEREDGAFTGEISAPMLADSGCDYVIVGHSERRRRFHESDALVAAKFRAAHAAGLTPILCVGETFSERESGRAEETVRAQLEAVIAKAGAAALGWAVIAYEPLWAIGSGRAATPEIAEVMHGFVRAAVTDRDADAGAAVRILYGGSVNAGNAGALFAKPDIDGALVGGASLDPESLLAIVAAAAATTSEVV